MRCTVRNIGVQNADGVSMRTPSVYMSEQYLAARALLIHSCPHHRASPLDICSHPFARRSLTRGRYGEY